MKRYQGDTRGISSGNATLRSGESANREIGDPGVKTANQEIGDPGFGIKSGDHMNECYFGQYPPDYFDFIVIDEYHRGEANDESN